MKSIQKYKTSSALYFIWLLAYLIWGIGFSLVAIMTEEKVYLFLIIGLASLGIFFWMLFKIYRAEANEDSIILRNISTKVILPWSEIVSIEESIKFPVAQVVNLKVTTKSGHSYLFPLDRSKKRAIGIPLESTTPMEEFIYKKIILLK